MITNTKFLNDFSKEIFEHTYKFGDEDINGMFLRVAKSIASIEEDKDFWAEKFASIFEGFKFVPGGRILSNAGTNLKGTTLINCFSPEANVLTKKGYVAIKNVKQGDYVLTHKGRWQKVNATTKRYYEGKLDVYKSSYLTDDIYSTKEHPFYQGDDKWEKSENNKKLVLLMSQTNNNKTIDLAEYFSNYGYQVDDNYISTSTNCIGGNGAIMTRCSKKIKRKINLDKDFAYFLGRYIGDGSVFSTAKDTDGFNIAFNKKEYSQLLFLKKKIEKIFDIDININDSKNQECIYLRKSNVVLAKFLEKICGKGYSRKKVPEFIWESSEDIKFSFLLGVFDADGFIDKKGSSIIAMQNESLINDLQALFNMIKIPCRKRYVVASNKKYKDAPCIALSSKFSKKFIFNSKKEYKDNRINEALREKQYNGVKTIIDNSTKKEKLHLVESFSKEEIDYKGYVYNISVEKDQSYIINNIIVHNCFVDGFEGKHQDSMEGILATLRKQALILKSEGGYGFCADVMRPRGGFVSGIANETPGSVRMLDMWDTQSDVITAGSGRKSQHKKSKSKIRKGAQMVTMSIWHPDIEEFITAKLTSGRLTKFNMSVLVTDEFMDAVKNNKPWNLEFPDFDDDKKYYDKNWDGNLKKWKKSGKKTVVYKTFEDANELWDIIMKSTYNRNEPGILFADTINRLNNLYYIEFISATNPCGEQLLPIGGVCLLGSINLTQFVKGNNWDYENLRKFIPTIVRFMDNVNDITYVPLKSQKDNLRDKRRVGIGIMGYGSALLMMKTAYGSKKALKLTKELMSFLTNEIYSSSARLAKEKGPFPLFDRDKYLQSNFIKNLEEETIKLIKKYGIRNSHLLSIQPTGNTSILAQGISSGLEPIFLYEYIRTAIIPYPPDGLLLPKNIDWKNLKYAKLDDEKIKWEWMKEGDENLLKCVFNNVTYKIDKNRGLLKETLVEDYAVSYLKEKGEWDEKSEWAKNISNLTIDEHIDTMAVLSRYIDSAMSKTINIPNDFPYEEFKNVYLKLYKTGTVKGGTTYRTGTMSSVLSEKNKEGKEEEEEENNGRIIKRSASKRPKRLPCEIHHLTAIGKEWTVIVGILEDDPYEAFAFKKKKIKLSSKFEKGVLTKIKSGLYSLEVGGFEFYDIGDLFEKDEQEALTRMISTCLRHGVDIKYIYEQLNKAEGTIVSFAKAIARTLKKYIKDGESSTENCPSCGAYKGLIFQEGCLKCKDCGFSKC